MTRRSRGLSQTEGGFVRADDEAAERIERDADQILTGKNKLGRSAGRHPVKSAFARQSLDDKQRPAGIEGDALRPAESRVERAHRPVGRDSDIWSRRSTASARSRRRRDRVRSRDERPPCCAGSVAIGSALPARSTPNNVPERSPTYSDPSCRERQPAGDAEIAANGLERAVSVDAVDRPLESARHVQLAVRVDRHRRGVDDA